jgi:hypothetical protein
MVFQHQQRSQCHCAEITIHDVQVLTWSFRLQVIIFIMQPSATARGAQGDWKVGLWCVRESSKEVRGWLSMAWTIAHMGLGCVIGNEPLIDVGSLAASVSML